MQGFGSRAAVAGRLMAQLVYPQFRKYPSVSALTVRAKLGSRRPSFARLVAPASNETIALHRMTEWRA
jgi:hypothetical protein